jgi:choline-sulfatase
MTDQHRADALGCTGGWVDTPNIDRLAAEGVRFANAYTNAPLCVPARVSLALGRYPHNTEVWKTQSHALPKRAPTWMRSVQAAGYTTALFGKTHLHPHQGDLRDREGLVRSWGLDHVDEIAGPRAAARCRSNLTDIWERADLYEAYQDDVRERYENKPWVVRPSPLPLNLYADVYVGRQAAAWLRNYSGEHPWCCWVSWGGPHEPWDTPEPYASRYSPADMPPPVPHEDPGTDRPSGVLDQKLDKFPEPFDPEDIARLRADYAGHVTLIDDQIGEVLRAVEERGELDRTLVVFVSDHGEQNGDHDLLYKGVFLDASVRIPLIVRLPPGDRPAGVVSEAMVELMDVGATLVDAAGGRPSSASHARSVIPAALDPARAHRRYALSELKQELMVATADHKLAVNRAGEPYLLFDLRADPEERRNLVGVPEYEEIQEALQGELHETVAAAR